MVIRIFVDILKGVCAVYYFVFKKYPINCKRISMGFITNGC